MGQAKYTYYAGGLLNTEDGPWTNDTVTLTYNNARLRSWLSLHVANFFAVILFAKLAS